MATALTMAVIPVTASAVTPRAPITEAPTELAAMKAAMASGHRVEVASARTELTTIFMEPSGRHTYEAASVPQRARRADGSWAPIDLTLRKGSDGLLRPGVSTVDVRFSGGGLDPVATLVREGKTMTLSWLGTLPAPAITGVLAWRAHPVARKKLHGLSPSEPTYGMYPDISELIDWLDSPSWVFSAMTFEGMAECTDSPGD